MIAIILKNNFKSIEDFFELIKDGLFENESIESIEKEIFFTEFLEKKLYYINYINDINIDELESSDYKFYEVEKVLNGLNYLSFLIIFKVYDEENISEDNLYKAYKLSLRFSNVFTIELIRTKKFWNLLYEAVLKKLKENPINGTFMTRVNSIDVYFESPFKINSNKINVRSLLGDYVEIDSSELHGFINAINKTSEICYKTDKLAISNLEKSILSLGKDINIKIINKGDRHIVALLDELEINSKFTGETLKLKQLPILFISNIQKALIDGIRNESFSSNIKVYIYRTSLNLSDLIHGTAIVHPHQNSVIVNGSLVRLTTFSVGFSSLYSGFCLGDYDYRFSEIIKDELNVKYFLFNLINILKSYSPSTRPYTYIEEIYKDIGTLIFNLIYIIYYLKKTNRKDINLLKALLIRSMYNVIIDKNWKFSTDKVYPNNQFHLVIGLYLIHLMLHDKNVLDLIDQLFNDELSVYIEPEEIVKEVFDIVENEENIDNFVDTLINSDINTLTSEIEKTFFDLNIFHDDLLSEISADELVVFYINKQLENSLNIVNKLKDYIIVNPNNKTVLSYINGAEDIINFRSVLVNKNVINEFYRRINNDHIIKKINDFIKLDYIAELPIHIKGITRKEAIDEARQSESFVNEILPFYFDINKFGSSSLSEDPLNSLMKYTLKLSSNDIPSMIDQKHYNISEYIGYVYYDIQKSLKEHNVGIRLVKDDINLLNNVNDLIRSTFNIYSHIDTLINAERISSLRIKIFKKLWKRLK